MEKRVIKRSKFMIASLLLLIFCAFYSSSTMFEHKHTINGATIIHSHFYGSHHSDTPDGEHTQSEITLIAYASLQSVVSSDAVSAPAAIFTLLCIFAVARTLNKEHKEEHRLYPSRAPPAQISLA